MMGTAPAIYNINWIKFICWHSILYCISYNTYIFPKVPPWLSIGFREISFECDFLVFTLFSVLIN